MKFGLLSFKLLKMFGGVGVGGEKNANMGLRCGWVKLLQLVQDHKIQSSHSVSAVLGIVHCSCTIVEFPVCLLSCKTQLHFNLKVIIQCY